MSKDKSEVKIMGKPVFYAMLYDSMKKKALELGYTLALHGSMCTDMDLIAVAWLDDAVSKEQLVEAMNECLGDNHFWKEESFRELTEKPNGRYSATLRIWSDWFIDLSIIPPTRGSK